MKYLGKKGKVNYKRERERDRERETDRQTEKKSSQMVSERFFTSNIDRTSETGVESEKLRPNKCVQKNGFFSKKMPKDIWVMGRF